MSEMKKSLIAVGILVILGILGAGATNRALLVGIGNYDTAKTGWSKIHGDADVDMLFNGLSQQGFATSNIKTLKNKEATKANIINALKELANRCQTGDKVFFHFSGHGQLVADVHNDEKDGLDESIVPFNAYRTSRYICNGKRYQGQYHILDDELNPLLQRIKQKIGKNGVLFVSIDACHSQGIELAEGGSAPEEDFEIMGEPRGTADVFRGGKAYLSTIRSPKHYPPGGKMIIVTACKTNERNFEYRIPGTNRTVGSLSHCLTQLLKQDADFGRWKKYFEKKRYKGQSLFISDQHPVVVFYE